MPCKYCYQLFEAHADADIYVRAWCAKDNVHDMNYFATMTNLEYLEYQYEKTQAI